MYCIYSKYKYGASHISECCVRKTATHIMSWPLKKQCWIIQERVVRIGYFPIIFHNCFNKRNTNGHMLCSSRIRTCSLWNNKCTIKNVIRKYI